MHKVNIIDVGAIGGLEPPWSRNRRHVGTVLEFEPDGIERITGDTIRLPHAIWSHNGRETLHFFKGGLGSASLKRQNMAWVREHYEEIKDKGSRRLNRTWFERSTCIRETEIGVRTLDLVLEDLRKRGQGVSPFHFLKSDTQSGEYDVLVGARSYLQEECAAALLEVFRYPLLEGIRLAEEVEVYMASFGFEVIGWSPWQASFESQRDVLFARREPTDAAQAASIEVVKRIYGVGAGPALFSHKRSLVERVVRKARMRLRLA